MFVHWSRVKNRGFPLKLSDIVDIGREEMDDCNISVNLLGEYKDFDESDAARRCSLHGSKEHCDCEEPPDLNSDPISVSLQLTVV